MDVIAILLFCFSTSITPGPNNIMVMSSGLNFGFKKTLPHLVGINIGFPLMIIAVGFGLGSLFKLFPSIHPIIKGLGVSYLFYLAWKISRTPVSKNQNSSPKPLSFMEAAIFQWVNPKAWVMAIGVIAAFTNPDNFIHQLSVIIGIYTLVGFLALYLWLILGVYLQKLIRNESQLYWFNHIMAVLLIASVIPMIYAELG